MLLLTDKTFRKLPGIYIIRNIMNGKEYIGQSINIRARLAAHRPGNTSVIRRAYKKYGLENFQVYIEYFPGITEAELGEMEKKLISECCSTVPNGYNVADGGFVNRGYKWTDEARAKLSKARRGKTTWNKGIPMTEEHKLKLLNSKIGKIYSAEDRKKMSDRMIGRFVGEKSYLFGKKGKNNPTCKQVSQYSKDGTYMTTFDSLTLAAEAVEGLRYNDISKCCHGINHTAYGFIWRFATPNYSVENIELPKSEKVHLNSRQVSQYTKEGMFVKTFKSLSDAEQSLHLNNISKSCRGKQKTVGGFIWKYADDSYGERVDVPKLETEVN